MAPRILALIAVLAAAAPAWGVDVISPDRYDGKRTPKTNESSSREIQIGPAVREAEELSRGSRVPGIFPVYKVDKRWMLVERLSGRKKRLVRRGTNLLVIGSKGVDRFYAARSTRTWVAECEGSRPVPRIGYILSAKSVKNFLRVGEPVIAIKLRKGARYDTSKARFYALGNEVGEDTYKRLGPVIRRQAAADFRSGDFSPGAASGPRRFSRETDLENVQIKIDFGSDIDLRGVKDAFLMVEGSQIGGSYRRCMRLFDGDQPLGGCTRMPHALMAETRLLHFVAYDPARQGSPFILAYTESEPLWGHERWGFQLSKNGAKVFLRDALDPRCREGF